jgi:hypothetical protein
MLQEDIPMPSRFAAITLFLYLAVALIACSKPPVQSASDESTATTSSGSSSGAASSTRLGTSSGTKSAVEKRSPLPTPVAVPAGTVVTVRLAQAVGSKISQPGQAFSATVVDPVEVNGQTVIPSGANASGTVLDAKPLGRFKGGAVLQLKLTSINFNGADHPVETSSIVRSAKGKGKRSAALIGGGAGLGAIIGGIAGGGKGAAIGALAGGGAGTAGTAFTGNKDIVLPAESALSFKLEQPLELK